MKLKIMMVMAGIMVCSSCFALAQESDTVSTASTDEQSQSVSSGTDYKEEIAGDRAAIEAQRDAMKANASAARQEEKQLKDQIRAAEESGDTATAEQLREQLKETHQANVQGMRQDKQEMKAAKQELRQDKKEARTDRMDTNDDGTVDKFERAQHEKRGHGRRDNDNNPPGAKGGPGTNWENRPGPKGGPGAGPDRGNRGVRDHGQGQGRGGRGQGGERRR